MRHKQTPCVYFSSHCEGLNSQRLTDKLVQLFVFAFNVLNIANVKHFPSPAVFCSQSQGRHQLLELQYWCFSSSHETFLFLTHLFMLSSLILHFDSYSVAFCTLMSLQFFIRQKLVTIFPKSVSQTQTVLIYTTHTSKWVSIFQRAVEENRRTISGTPLTPFFSSDGRLGGFID